MPGEPAREDRLQHVRRQSADRGGLQGRERVLPNEVRACAAEASEAAAVTGEDAAVAADGALQPDSTGIVPRHNLLAKLDR